MAIRITGIRKPGGANNAHEAISHYRWIEDGKAFTSITDRQTVVGWVENGVSAYVSGGSIVAYCQVRQSAGGTRYLQTVSDGKFSDNLLSLPEC
jgi:hypothetical protein